MIIDSLIGYFSPSKGLERIRHRAAIDVLQTRKYEGAARTRRTQGWLAPSTNANAAKEGQIETLRNRSRDLCRNNPYAKRAKDVVATSTIGKGIKANINAPTDTQRERIQGLWDKWAKSPRLIDFDKALDFDSLCGLVMESVFESGEVLVRRRHTEDGFGLALQLLEADHLCPTNETNLARRNRIVQGIELDDGGRPIMYHLYKNHPGNMGAETSDYGKAFDIVEINADDIIHVFKKTRPGELRGAPWLAPVTVRLRELDEFEDAMIVRQKIAACFSAFVHDIESPSEFSDLDSDEKRIEKLEPGMIEYLPPGKDIKFGTPPLPQAEAYKFFIATHLRSIAAGIGITYESLAGDLSEVNYSSARVGRLDFDRNVDSWRLKMLFPMLLDRLFAWFLESLKIIGENIEGVGVTWVAPKVEIIDPTKEIPAQIRAVRAGIASLSDVVRQSGKDPTRHFEEIARDNALLDSLGLVFDSDPRRVTAAGMIQIEPDGDSPDIGEKE
jgi:lambda family phage portal protein